MPPVRNLAFQVSMLVSFVVTAGPFLRAVDSARIIAILPFIDH